MMRVFTIGAVVIGLALASCGGGDEESTTSTAPSGGVEVPSGSGPPPSSPGSLPPEFIECMADQGFDIASSADIHSAPPQVLQLCFGSLHQGGAAP